MRAAIITEIGAPPAIDERDPPVVTEGDELILDVLAVAFNPVDVAIATGRFYAGHPPLPYVPGVECVGRPVGEQRLVYAQGAGMGIAQDGFAADQVAVSSSIVVEIPASSDPATAVALGTAGLAGWVSVIERGRAAPDDVAVVLGATGTAGHIALQAARARGVQRLVAVGRSPGRLAELGDLADATVAIEGDDLAGRITTACGQAPTLIIDLLWATPAMAAVAAAAPGARIVQIGASAGPDAIVSSAAVRGKQLELLGYSNFGLPRETFAESYQQLVGMANEGRVTLDVERYPLIEVAAAWDAAAGGRAKAVVCPDLDRRGGGA